MSFTRGIISKLPPVRILTAVQTKTDDGAAYVVNDVIGPNGANALLTFANAGAPGSKIQILESTLSVAAAANEGQTVGLNSLIFNDVPTVINGNSAIALVAGDAAKLMQQSGSGGLFNFSLTDTGAFLFSRTPLTTPLIVPLLTSNLYIYNVVSFISGVFAATGVRVCTFKLFVRDL